MFPSQVLANKPLFHLISPFFFHHHCSSLSMVLREMFFSRFDSYSFPPLVLYLRRAFFLRGPPPPGFNGRELTMFLILYLFCAAIFGHTCSRYRNPDSSSPALVRCPKVPQDVNTLGLLQKKVRDGESPFGSPPAFVPTAQFSSYPPSPGGGLLCPLRRVFNPGDPSLFLPPKSETPIPTGDKVPTRKAGGGVLC